MFLPRQSIRNRLVSYRAECYDKYQWIFVSASFVYLFVFKGITYFKVELLISEPHVFSGDKSSQKNVDSFSYSEGHSHYTVSSRLTVKATDEIGKIVQDGEVMLNEDNVVVVGLKPSDQLCTVNALLDIEVRGGLVEYVDFGFLDHYDQ
mgnify:FL=1